MSFCGQAPTPTVVEMTLANCIVVAGSSVQKAKQRVTGELEETRACCDENAGGTKLSRNTVLSARVPRPVCYLPATGFSCIGK
jgi:hypothetical protein